MGAAHRVFLSHTSELARFPAELSFVEAAKRACSRERLLSSDMSEWSAAPFPAAEECRRAVAECDVFLAMVGISYGSPVRDEDHHSYVELEFETAAELGLPMLVFLLDEEAQGIPIGAARGDPAYAARQEAFRRRLLCDDRFTLIGFRNPDQLDNLVGHALRRLVEAPSPDQPPYMPGALPVTFVPRPQLAAEIAGKLTVASGRGGVGDDEGPVVALHGPPGFGKTALAAWVCRALQRSFPDGVLWVDLGPAPSTQQLVYRCRDLAVMLGAEDRRLSDLRAAGEHLAAALGRRRLLLVLDDAWHEEDLEPFLRGGPATVRLVTTRDRDLLPPHAVAVTVEDLSDDQVRELLTRGLDAELSAGVDWSPLLRRIGGWALLAELVRGVLLDEANRPLAEVVAEVASTLAAHGPSVLDPLDPQQREKAVGTSVEASLRRLHQRLGRDAVARYRDLAIFPDGVDVPLRVLAQWWRLDLLVLRRWAAKLARLALLEAYDAPTATVRLHTPVRDYLAAQRPAGALHARHDDLLAASRPPTGRWADLPDDADYLWHHVGAHLAQAGRLDELLDTVRDVRFLAAKIHRLGVPATLEDLALVGDELAEERRAWLWRSGHLVEDLPRAADVAATLLARPGASRLLLVGVFSTPDPPFLRYAAGWASPELTDEALEGVIGRHSRRVHAVAWSADGQAVASAGADGRTWVRDLGPSGRRTSAGGEEWVRALSWSRDGRLACGSDDGRVRVWTPEQDDCVAVARHEGGVRAVAWSPDASRLGSAADDGVLLSCLDGSEPVRVLTGTWAWSLAWSPTGDLLAYGDDDGRVRVRHAAGEPDEVELPGHPGPALALAWSSDGDTIASGGRDGVIRLVSWDRPGNAYELDRETSSVRGLAWSRNGRRLAAVSDDGAVRYWDLAVSGEAVRLGRHELGALAVEWSQDGSHLATGGCDGDVRLWRVSDGGTGEPGEPSESACVCDVAWSPTGEEVAAGGRDGAVLVWPVDGPWQPRVVTRHDGAAGTLAWSRSKWLASGGSDGRIVVGEDDADEFEALRAPGGCARRLAWSPDGVTLACAGGDGTIGWWRMEGNARVPVGVVGESVRTVAWSLGGDLLIAGHDDGALRLWDPSGRRPAVTVGDHDVLVASVAACPGSPYVASGGPNGVRLWDVDHPGRCRALPGHEEGVGVLAPSADGRWLATAGCDGVLAVWDLCGAVDPEAVDEVVPLCTLGLVGALNGVAWHPRRPLLAAASSTGLHILEYVENRP